MFTGSPPHALAPLLTALQCGRRMGSLRLQLPRKLTVPISARLSCDAGASGLRQAGSTPDTGTRNASLDAWLPAAAVAVGFRRRAGPCAERPLLDTCCNGSLYRHLHGHRHKFRDRTEPRAALLNPDYQALILSFTGTSPGAESSGGARWSQWRPPQPRHRHGQAALSSRRVLPLLFHA